jgi:hypothetical protein
MLTAPLPRLTPRETQEVAIRRALDEPTRAILIGDDMGFGKTVIGSEIAIRGDFDRVLFIGIKDTFGELANPENKGWAGTLYAQSEGRVVLRRIDATKAGQVAYDDMMAGEPGFYFAGAQYLVKQDWKSVPAFEKNGEPAWKREKKDDFATGVRKGDMIFVDRPEWSGKFRLRAPGEIGPAATPLRAIGPEREPIRVMVSQHQGTYRKMKKPLDLVVFDEVQMIANRKSNSRRTLGTIKPRFKVAMSGTWFGNTPENAWSIARWLWPEHVETNFDRWKKQYIAEEVVYGQNGKALTTPSGRTLTKTTGEREPGAFAATLPCYIRRENDQKPPEPKVVYCDPTPAQAAQMEDLKKDLVTWVMNWEGEEMPLVVDIPPVLRSRLRQLAIAELSFDEDGGVVFADDAASAKLVPLRGLLDNAYAGKQVGIYTDSKIGAKFIAQRMQRAGYAAEAWHGDLSPKERDSLKSRFIRGEVRYLISTIQSFGTGLDGFQTASNKVIWISEVDGNPSLNDQAIHRYFRPGRIPDTDEDYFEHTKILMNGSTDIETMERLLHKAWNMRASMAVAA